MIHRKLQRCRVLFISTPTIHPIHHLLPLNGVEMQSWCKVTSNSTPLQSTDFQEIEYHLVQSVELVAKEPFFRQEYYTYYIYHNFTLAIPPLQNHTKLDVSPFLRIGKKWELYRVWQGFAREEERNCLGIIMQLKINLIICPPPTQLFSQNNTYFLKPLPPILIKISGRRINVRIIKIAIIIGFSYILNLLNII